MAIGKPLPPVRIYIARVVDAVTYGAVVALIGCLISGAIGFLFLGSLNGMKFVLFIVGFVQIGVGVVELWPTDISDVENTNEQSPDELSGVQIIVDWLVPTDWLGLPPDERFEHGVRQLLAGGLMLVISFTMEAVFGITG